jgi:cell division septum initiation protein DivIVA
MINKTKQIHNLQVRLKELEEENKLLKTKVNTLNQSNSSLILKSRELRGQVRLLKGKKESFSTFRPSNKEVLKRNRSKKIFGILKNAKKYKLKPVEKLFLNDIRYEEELSEKQLKWYNNICERGFTKMKTNYNKQS